MKGLRVAIYFSVASISALILTTGCADENDGPALPTVHTGAVTDIGSVTAVGGGEVATDAGELVTARGVCWDVYPNPTVELQTKTVDGHGSGPFSSELTQLVPNQQYYVRAYATSKAGTTYGNEVVFVTDEANTIIYKTDGRIVKQGDPHPIALDVSGDGFVDYTIFVELTANGMGDRLYAGMNPIGANEIKSGPANDENFLNMGLLIAETPGTLINEGLSVDQRWTGDFGTLVIRNTSFNGAISYEGGWAGSTGVVGIKLVNDGKVYFGWLRIEFDKTTEIVTLVDYAYNTTSGEAIAAGAMTK